MAVQQHERKTVGRPAIGKGIGTRHISFKRYTALGAFCVALAGTADSNKDYEYRVQTWRETMIDLAAIRLLLNRISPQ